ncbi:MAG TPA: hypothetical protein VGN13_10715 [Solirubrobacteraceae bacterium]|jgi:hypothetical protein
MPRPLVKRKRPKPGPITIRRVGADTPEETISAPEMARHVDKVRWIRETTAVSLDVYAEQERLATYLRLEPNDTVTIPAYTQDAWWFVQDVDAPQRALTADTLLFGVPLERTFHFHMVVPRRLRECGEECEAAVALNTLKQHRAAKRSYSATPVSRRS